MAIAASPRSLGGPTSTSARQRSVASVLATALNAPLADYYLALGATVLLLGFGVTMVLSSSSVDAIINFDDPYYYVKRQVIFLALGGVGCWYLSRRRPGSLRVLGWIGVFLALGLLAATFVPHVGVVVAGNRNWIDLHVLGLRIQPSEFAKLAMIVWGADLFARRGRRLEEPMQLFVPFVPVCALMISMVVLEHDLGTSMVMMAIAGAMLFFAGTSAKILAGVGGGVLAAVAGLVALSPNRMLRIGAFLNPGADHQGMNQQSLQSMYALASGGWWGRGLGASRQKWGALPEAHTDFVFAILGEELGLLGALTVVFLFLVLGYAGIRTALRADSMFARLAAGGVTAWLMIQGAMNIAVVLRLLPVIGVPLPFVSYGGSALLADLLALGVLLACARYEPEARAALAKRGDRSRPKLVTIVDGGRG